MKRPKNAIMITIPEEQLWENLKISNDFMFAKVMRNPELCKRDKRKVEYMTLLLREREKYKEGYAEGELVGEARGIIEFAIDMGYSSENILPILQRKLNIDADKAKDYLKRFYEGTL